MESIGSRLRAERKRLGYKQEDFAQKGGVAVQTLRKYESDARRPDADYLAGIADAGADVSYIITGQREDEGPVNMIREEATEYAAIPLVDVRAAAGSGAIVDSEYVVDVLHFKHEWINHELHAVASDLRLLFVEGESMEPGLRAGDIILVNVRDQHAQRDGIYVLRLEDALLVKRLQRLPGGKLRVSSDNSAYESFELTLPFNNDDAAIIGRVVWMGRRV